MSSSVTSNSPPRTNGAQAVVGAAVSVLVRDGLDGLSVRRVATEAGVSIGAVQHHFATKDALLVAAARHVTARFNSRAADLTRQIGATKGPAAAFLAICQLLANALPGLDDRSEDSDASIVWLWYAAKATQPGVVADAFKTGWSQTEEYLCGFIADLYPHLDAVEEAAHLLAVLDGLAIARAAEPERMPQKRASAIVERHASHLANLESESMP